KILFFSFIMTHHPPTSTLFPYTTLFRSSRFPPDFMFQLTEEETAALRSQIAISNTVRGGRRYRPLVFTEQGVAMLSSVLHSERRSEEHTSELQSRSDLVCRLLLEKKNYE